MEPTRHGNGPILGVLPEPNHASGLVVPAHLRSSQDDATERVEEARKNGELLYQLQPGTPKPIKYEPMYDKIVIAVTGRTEMRGGIEIPDTSTQINLTGVVVAVGPGRIVQGCAKLQPLQVNVGDEVQLAFHDGRDVVLKDTEDRPRLYRIMPEEKLMGILQRKLPI